MSFSDNEGPATSFDDDDEDDATGGGDEEDDDEEEILEFDSAPDKAADEPPAATPEE